MQSPTFQKAGKHVLTRSDHVWFRKNGVYKCCLCGAITREPPPAHPTDKHAPNWMPDRYELLTDEERELCPDLGRRH